MIKNNNYIPTSKLKVLTDDIQIEKKPLFVLMLENLFKADLILTGKVVGATSLQTWKLE